MTDVSADASADGPVTTPATATYSRIYEEEQPRLVAYARSLTGNAWVADDLVAEAHFRVWRRLSAGHEIENVPAYLMTTVRNLAVTVGRGSARETPHDPHAPESVEAVEAFGAFDGVAGVGDDPGDRVSSVDLLGRVLGQLPERWVKALWLAEAEGQPLETVGRRIGAGQGATAVLLHRAREGMRQAFLRAHPGTPEDPACEQHWDRIPGHIRGEASARQSERLLAHLDGCADCRGRLALLARANDRLPALVGPALLIFVLGGAGKFLVPLAAGSVGAGSVGAGSAAGSGGHGGFLHGIRHALTGGGKLPVAAVGAVGASLVGAAVAAGLLLGGSGSGHAVPPQRAASVERGVPEQAPAPVAPAAPTAPAAPAAPAPDTPDAPDAPDAPEPGSPPAEAEAEAEVEAEAPEQKPAAEEAPAKPEAPEAVAPDQSEAPVPAEPVAPAEPSEPAAPPVPTPTPTPTPTPPPATQTPTPVPTPVEPTPVEPTPVEPTSPPEPVCERWVGPIYVCHSP
ncbi:sigma factor [Streptomyces sp. NPDC055243]|uniref:sigma factor n=1 Tax=Streptomyces sp. NPDC055243 TaxID=3365720 RepID=UPI0037CD1FF6